MSCFISTGLTFQCSDGLGGIKKIYVVGGSATAEITGYTYDAEGSITGATSTSGTKLLGFDVKRNTSSFVQTVTKSFENSSVFFEGVLTVVFYKYDEEKRNILEALSQNDQLQIIAIDQNDVQYMVGQVNGAYLSGGDANSGTALGDGNKMTFIFSSQEPTPSRVIQGALGTVFTGATIVN